MKLKPLTLQQILEWADTHRERTGEWPSASDERIVGAHGETWLHVDGALKQGFRGLRGGSSLAKLLRKRRGARTTKPERRLYVERILDWADGEHKRTGMWPNISTGPIRSAPGETWYRVQLALKEGRRGLPGGSSIARFLEEHRGVRNKARLKHLTIRKILRWADAHHKRTGRWPTRDSGVVEGSDGTTWMAVQDAMYLGGRGLPGGDTLAQLFEDRRGVRNIHGKSKITIKQILEWADAHMKRTGKWPMRGSGPVHEAPSENWASLNHALKVGDRGLPGGATLAILLARQRRKRYQPELPKLTESKILKWAKLHYAKTGCWPSQSGGPVLDAPGEVWRNVDSALYKGLRGLPGGDSVAQLLDDYDLKPRTLGPRFGGRRSRRRQ